MWSGALIGVLSLFLVALFAWGRLTGHDDPQLRLLQQPAPTAGRNAFAALWLMDYPVPVDQLQAVAALDVQRFTRMPAPQPSSAGGAQAAKVLPPPVFVSIAHARYPGMRADADAAPALCSLQQDDCLARVRNDRDAYARRVAGERGRIGRAAALSGVGHYRNGFPARMDRPFPAMGSGHRALLTSHALAFVDGDTQAAMEGVCRNVGTWRPLVTHSDSLEVSMLGIRIVQASSDLLAQMLAALPAGAAVPEVCTTAYAAPLPDEYLPCDAMKGEFHYVTSAVAALNRSAESLTFNREMTRAALARQHAGACSATAREQAARGEPVPPVPVGGWWRPRCVGNLAGCILTSVGAPAYVGYWHRNQDHAARLQLMATLLWLQRTSADTRPLPQRLAARPEALRSRGRTVALADGVEGKVLRIDLFDQRPGKSWQVPLAPNLYR